MVWEKKSAKIKKVLNKFYNRPSDGSCCIVCGSKKVSRKDFADHLSWKEFQISLMCQKCQDDIFNECDELGDDE